MTDISYCGCSLPSGVYGSGGWHQTRATASFLLANEQRRFAKDRPGWGQIQLRAEWDSLVERMKQTGEWDGELKIPRWLRPYIGTAYCLEPCPAYRAAIARELAQEKKRKATTGRKRMYGESEEGE